MPPSSFSDCAPRSFSPSALNRSIRELLEIHFNEPLWVEGELSNFSCPSSGHWYFTLKDAQAQVRCALFRGKNQRLRYRPKNGDAVRLRARVSLYEARGDYQLIGEYLEPAGAGALQARFEALRDRLRAEGLFDTANKKALPRQPRHLAVITSPTGAALQDILTVLARRNPLLRVSVLPVAVQGADAAPQICAALERANRLSPSPPFDAVLLARGGGSLEDIWAFNEETVARAIAASRLPVVSGVGHEVDVTIADFAADARAPTPSAAAELLSEDLSDLPRHLATLRGRLLQQIRSVISQQRRELEHRRRQLRHPGAVLRQQAQRIDDLELRLRRSMRARVGREHERLLQRRLRLLGSAPRRRLERHREQLQGLVTRLRAAPRDQLSAARLAIDTRSALLNSLSPLAVLDRGYALLSDDAGELVRDSSAVRTGARLEARLARGRLSLTVDEVTGNTDPHRHG